MSEYDDLIGKHYLEIDTPALVVDVPRMEANLKYMVDYCARHDVKLRPHVKTHKSSVLAKRQIGLSDTGVTVAKLGEAEVLVQAGIHDILIANEIVGARKIDRLCNIAREASISVAVDDPNNVVMLDQALSLANCTISAFVELNVGLNRCGVDTQEDALVLAQAVANSRHVQFKGIMAYEGHLMFVEDRVERERKATRAFEWVGEVKDYLERRGIEVTEITGGGTGTYDITGVHPVVTEIQAGSYIFMDATYRKIVPTLTPALSLLTSVISRPRPERIVIDAGMKSITHEFGIPVVHDLPGAEIERLSEEHGRVVLKDSSVGIRPGDKFCVIPSHGCTTINLHDCYFAVDNDIVVDVWPIDCRGRFR